MHYGVLMRSEGRCWKLRSSSESEVNACCLLHGKSVSLEPYFVCVCHLFIGRHRRHGQQCDDEDAMQTEYDTISSESDIRQQFRSVRITFGLHLSAVRIWWSHQKHIFGIWKLSPATCHIEYGHSRHSERKQQCVCHALQNVNAMTSIRCHSER